MIVKVVVLKEKEGFIVKIYGENVLKKVNLVWVYGGVIGKKFSCDGDIGVDFELVFYL